MQGGMKVASQALDRKENSIAVLNRLGTSRARRDVSAHVGIMYLGGSEVVAVALL